MMNNCINEKTFLRTSVGLFFIFIALTALALISCSRKAETRRPFTMRVPMPMTSFDPVQTVDAATLQIHLNTYSLLFRQRASGKVEPSLALSATPLDNGRTWKVTIRSGVRFCNSRYTHEVLAEDVAATLRRAATHPASRVAWLFSALRSSDEDGGVKVTGKYELVLSFKKPIDLPRYLTLPQLGILPHEVAADKDFVFGQESIGSGPYRIAAVEPGTIRLQRCESGFPRANLPSVDLKVIRDENVALEMLKSRTIDAMEVDFTGWHEFNSGNNSEIPGYKKYVVDKTADFEFLLFNVQNPAVKAPLVRRALMYALDRRELCSTALKDYCSPVSFIPKYGNPVPEQSGEDDPLYRPELARKLWQDAGAARPSRLELYAFSETRNYTVAQWVARQWEKLLGVKVDVKTYDFGSLFGILFGGQGFEISELWVQPLSDLYEIWYLAWQPDDLPPRGRNISRYQNPTFKKLFADLVHAEFIQGARNPDDIKRLMSRVEEVLEDDPPAIPLYARKQVWLVSNRYKWQFGPYIVPELWQLQETE